MGRGEGEDIGIFREKQKAAFKIIVSSVFKH